MKKIKFLTIFFILSLFLGGCSRDNREVLKFSSWGSQTEVAVIKPLLDKFEKENPNIQIEFMHAPANYFSKLHLYFAAGMEPDVIFLNNIYFPKYYESNLLADLSQEFAEDIKNDIFFKSSTESFFEKGKLYAIPRDVSNVVIYYNKTLFKRNGLPYPKSDWTLDDLYKYAGALTEDSDGDGKIDIWGINRNTRMINWQAFLVAENEGLLDKDGYLAINKPHAIEVLQKFADLVTVDKIAPADNVLSGQTHPQLFMNGKLGMYVGGRWNMPQFSKINNFEWDVINFPSGKNDFIPADASGWAVAERSKHKEAAVKLVKFLSSKDSIRKFTDSGLITPARKDIANSDAFLKNPAKKNNGAFLYAVEHSRAQTGSAHIDEIVDTIYTELEPAFNGSKKVKDVFEQERVIKKMCDLTKCK